MVHPLNVPLLPSFRILRPKNYIETVHGLYQQPCPLIVENFLFVLSIRIENQTFAEWPRRHLCLKILCCFQVVLLPKVLFMRKVFKKCHDNTGLQLPKISLEFYLRFIRFLKFLISLKFSYVISSPIRAAMPTGKDHGDHVSPCAR